MPVANAEAPAKPRAPQRLLNLLLVIGSILFFWVLVELPAALNIFDYEGLEYNQVWGNLRFIRVPDPELIHIEPPHAHYSGSSRGGDFEMKYSVPPAEQTLYHWDLRYDAHGFRNPVDLSKADIVLIGDSMAEGMTVSDDRIASSLLAKSTGKVVVNLGQYGYGPQQEMAVLKRFGLALKPRLVIWMFFEGNDVSDETEYRRMQLDPPGPFNHFLQRSFTRFAFRFFSRLAQGAKPSGAVRSCTLTTADDRKTMYFTYDSHAVTPEEDESITRIASAIANARHLASEAGSDFLFAFAPDKFRVLRDSCEFPTGSDASRWAVNDLPARLGRSLNQASPGIAYLDLTPSLRESAAHGATPYYTDDIHFNENGHLAASNAIAAFLGTKK